MQFSIQIKDTTSPFYQACKNHGQTMGVAVPYLIATESSLFKVVHTSNSMFLEDNLGKTYKTHFGNGKKFNVAPSYMKGHGRSVNKAQLEEAVSGFDYHLFSHQQGDSIVCNILSSKSVMAALEEDGSLYIEQ